MDSAAGRFPRPWNLRRLLDVGGISGSALLFWQLHLAVLLAGDCRFLAAQLVWTETDLVAGLAFVFTGTPDFVGTGRISSHVLLLPRRVLQSLLG